MNLNQQNPQTQDSNQVTDLNEQDQQDEYYDQPIPNCFEFQINGFHLNGTKNCPVCNMSYVEPVKEKLIDAIDEMIAKKDTVQTTDNKSDDGTTDNQFEVLDPERYMELYNKYKGCSCCNGLVFNCSGAICNILGACECYRKDQQDQFADQ